jgi:hypothetical protein
MAGRFETVTYALRRLAFAQQLGASLGLRKSRVKDT